MSAAGTAITTGTSGPWWRRLTWQATLSWPAFSITLVYVVTISTVASTALYSTSLTMRLLAHALGVIAAYSALFLAYRLVRRGRLAGERQEISVLVSMLVASAACGIATAGAVVILGLTSDPDVEYRIPISLVVVTPGLILASLTTQSWTAHREQVRGLLTDQARLTEARDRLELSIEDDISALITTQSQVITGLLDDIDPASPEGCLASLRSVSDDLVRPLSHQLARDGGTAQLPEPKLTRPRTTLGQFLVDMTSPGGVRPLPYAVMMGVLSAGFGLAFGAFTSAGILGAIAFTTVLAATWLAGQAYAPMHRALSARHFVPILFIIQVVLYAVVGTLTLTAIRLTGQLEISEVPVAFAELIFVLVGVGLSAQAAAAVQRARTAEELQHINDELLIQVGRAQILSWRARQQLSRRIHGPLQSAFNAAAVRLEVLIRSGDYLATTLPSLLAPIRQAVTDLSAADELIDMVAELNRLTGVWSGACDVTVDAEPGLLADLDRDPAIATAVVEIATELTSNAVRHGRANRIVITIDVGTEGTMTITAADNGTMADSGKPGLGTLLLERTALSWMRTSTAQGATVKCLLPAPRTRSSTRAGPALATAEGLPRVT